MGFPYPALRSTTLRVAMTAAAALGLCIAALAIVSSGRAAAQKICTTPSNLTADPAVYASCVKGSVLPHKANVGNDAQSVMQFTNQGSNTASHVSLQTTFRPAVTVKAIRLLKNGVDQGTSSCTISTAADESVVKCADFANFVHGDTGRLVVRFTSSSQATVLVTPAAFYAESGQDKQGGPQGTRNDNQTGRPDAVAFVPAGDPASGGCTNTGGNVTDGNALQTTVVAYNATSDPSLLCSPAGAGVIPTVPAALKTYISFIEIAPQAGAGYANVRILFTPLPPNTTVKKIAIREDTSLETQPFFTTYITVPDGCNATTGLPPRPGPVEPGATDADIQHHNDLCITDRLSLPQGGGEIRMHLIGTAIDPRVGGG